MDEKLYQFELVLGDRTVESVWDRIRRYCGLPWSGGAPETWAYRYYDAVVTDDRTVVPVDVLSTTALHPGLSRADLTWFYERSTELDRWLASIPVHVGLGEAGDDLLDRLADVSRWEGAPSVSLLTKVLHRKRPALIPLVDRHILDWYRPITGERSAALAWPSLLRALRQDLFGQNALRLVLIGVELEKELGRSLTPLRLVDIAIWMGSRR